MSYETEVHAHIRKVQALIADFTSRLTQRGIDHDASKLMEPEKTGLEEATQKVRDLSYYSSEYLGELAKVTPLLEHHYRLNSHHPEHHHGGVGGMTLLDVIEMYCDWKASTDKHPNGTFERSLVINKQRFQVSEQLASIFDNTRKELNW